MYTRSGFLKYCLHATSRWRTFLRFVAAARPADTNVLPTSVLAPHIMYTGIVSGRHIEELLVVNFRTLQSLASPDACARWRTKPGEICDDSRKSRLSIEAQRY